MKRIKCEELTLTRVSAVYGGRGGGCHCNAGRGGGQILSVGNDGMAKKLLFLFFFLGKSMKKGVNSL